MSEGDGHGPSSSPPAGQVVFLASIDWGAAWQRHQAFAAALAAEGRQVFFVENTGFRDLRLSDLSRGFGRLARLTMSTPAARNAPPPRVTVVSPLVLPPTCALFRGLNAAVFLPPLAARQRARGGGDRTAGGFNPVGLLKSTAG